ncbi:MAG: glycosyltransferase family 39 protein, partial [Anaerolineales bacterium]|nr:glycosyltransferase family 39 protein [Anaerolineales bacterium]
MSAKVPSAEQRTSPTRRGFGRGRIPPEGSLAWSWALGGFLLLCLAVGLAIGNDFGASTDEYFNARVGRQSVREYLGTGAQYDDPSVLADHGPVYFIPWALIGDTIGRTIPGWARPDGRHFFNYLGFLVGVWCFYLVAQRFVRRSAAWMASLLFATQPLLFGYAFINQKDIPFMVFFLATVASGFAAVERQKRKAEARGDRPPEAAHVPSRTQWNAVVADWRAVPTGLKLGLALTCLLGLIALCDLLLIGLLRIQSGALLQAAYEGRASPLVQRIFSGLAQDAYKTPLALYQEKLAAGFNISRLMVVPIVTVIVVGTASLAIPTIRKALRALFRGPLPLWFLSGVLLGCTVTIRQVGVLAGGLVSVYMLGTLKRRALLPFIMLWGVAAATTYATWPYLWPDPIQRFLESLASASRFGGKKVLFNGEFLPSEDLPWNYFPTLASLELTEPAVLLILLGLPVLVWRLARGRTDWISGLVMGLWLGVPLAGVYLLGMTVYDNLRHFLFVLPVLFLLSGLSIELIVPRLKSSWARIGFLALVLAPGILGLVRMHPYQYAYFNAFVGGVSGAQGRYDPEHWCTSYREAMQVVNEVAQEEAKVLALGQPWSAEMFAR